MTVEFNPYCVACDGAPSELVKIVVRSAKPTIRENESGSQLIVEELRDYPHRLTDRHQRTNQAGLTLGMNT